MTEWFKAGAILQTTSLLFVATALAGMAFVWFRQSMIPKSGCRFVGRKIESYRWYDYHYVYLDLSEGQRREAVRFAYSCLKQKYGTLSSLLLGVAVLLGDRLRVPERGQQGCGALIARALQRAGMKFERSPVNMFPADLAKRFGVRP